jgi:hypothetical protein
MIFYVFPLRVRYREERSINGIDVSNVFDWNSNTSNFLGKGWVTKLLTRPLKTVPPNYAL